MKIFELDHEIVVDSIPFVYEPNRKIFLTSLLHIGTHTLPKIFPKIYTSETLKNQFILYLKNKNVEIAEDNFHVWNPFVPEKVTLSNGTCYEILPCCPKDSTTSILLVFRQGSTISHIYVGLCSDLRSTLLNMTLVSWLRKGANTSLYVPLNEASKRCVDCEFRKAMKKIEKKLNSDNLAKLLIQLPLFGCEAFITAVATAFRGYVSICGLLKEMYMILPTVQPENFTEDFRSARIIITANDTAEFLSNNLKRDGSTISRKYTVKWSPLPSWNELKLLFDLVQPRKLYGTKFQDSHEALEQPVQISSILLDSNQSSRELPPRLIKRQIADDDQCCLEKCQRLEQQVIENVKMFLNQSTTRGSESKQQDDSIVDLTRSSPTENIPDTTMDASPSAARGQEISGETHERQCENQPPNSTEIQVDTAKRGVDSNKNIVENPLRIVRNLNESKAMRRREETAKDQSTDSSRRSLSAKSNDKIGTDQTTNGQQTENVESTTQSACLNKSVLVYRKGKRGIGFVDDDSSSSG